MVTSTCRVEPTLQLNHVPFKPLTKQLDAAHCMIHPIVTPNHTPPVSCTACCCDDRGASCLIAWCWWSRKYGSGSTAMTGLATVVAVQDSKAMQATTKHTSQVATSEVVQVEQLTASAWQFVQQWAHAYTHQTYCGADTLCTSVCSASNQLGSASAAVPAEVCSPIPRAGSTLDSRCAQGSTSA